MPAIYPSQPIFYGQTPPEGSRYLDLAVSWQNQASLYGISSGSIDAGSSGMSAIQAGRIDNSNNYFDIYISFQDTNDVVRIPAYSITTFPIYTGNKFLQYSLYTDSFFLSSPIYNPVKLRLYNFSLDNYQSVFTYGRTGTGVNVASNLNANSPGLTQPIGNTLSIAVPANTVTQVLAGFRTRYKYSISSITSGTYSWDILSETVGSPGNYILIAGFVGSQNPWVEQQALPDQFVTKTAIYIKSTAAVSIAACQWCTSGYDTFQQ